MNRGRGWHNDRYEHKLAGMGLSPRTSGKKIDTRPTKELSYKKSEDEYDVVRYNDWEQFRDKDYLVNGSMTVLKTDNVDKLIPFHKNLIDNMDKKDEITFELGEMENYPEIKNSEFGKDVLISIIEEVLGRRVAHKKDPFTILKDEKDTKVTFDLKWDSDEKDQPILLEKNDIKYMLVPRKRDV